MALILTVDDEEDIRFLVKTNLELDGHRVETAANGAEALDFVRRTPPDLIILDVMMPHTDGFEVLEQIKSAADADTQTIPVIMLTAMSADQSRLRGGIEGALRYLVKPINPDDLRDAVDASLAAVEPEERRLVQGHSLKRLAEIEKGQPTSPGPAPRLSRLENRHGSDAASPMLVEARRRLGQLTPKQAELLRVLTQNATVSAAADELGVSRSNVYASLRRVARKLGVTSVPELLEMVRRGQLASDA